MSQYPSVTGKELVAVLKRSGFVVVRIKGSHHFLRHEDGLTTVVPVHAGETLGKGLLLKILGVCDLTQEELQDLL
jgi:predicted RNA binding protein YcfA (HicA-like mRNA interferase family)